MQWLEKYASEARQQSDVGALCRAATVLSEAEPEKAAALLAAVKQRLDTADAATTEAYYTALVDSCVASGRLSDAILAQEAAVVAVHTGLARLVGLALRVDDGRTISWAVARLEVANAYDSEVLGASAQLVYGPETSSHNSRSLGIDLLRSFLSQHKHRTVEADLEARVMLCRALLKVGNAPEALALMTQAPRVGDTASPLARACEYQMRLLATQAGGAIK